MRGLVRSLVRQRHGTPVEKGYLEFYIHAPIFITREIIRHRVAVSPSEESGRYKDLEPSKRTETRGWGNRDEAETILAAARERA